MKLMTKTIEKKLSKYSFGSQESLGEDAEVIVKFFNPCGSGTWLVTEGEKQENGDWLFFGKVNIYETEYGYFSLSELQSLKIKPFNLGIERDLYLIDKKIKDIKLI